MIQWSFFSAGVLLLNAMVFSYGEKVDTLYTWQERAVHTLTNTCRLSPEAYRDAYLFSKKILLPTTYPAVPPLYWNRELNAAAKFHAVEMAGTCGMNHTCDGKTFDVRIKEFFTESSTIGENIASGYTTPQATMKAWLLDRLQSGDTALDGSNNDGHRANIMSKNYNRLGCGYYALGTAKPAKLLWCQDFAGIRNAKALHPIPSASHLFLESGKITFMANVFDTVNTFQAVNLIIGDVATPLVLTMGAAGKGTYMLSLPLAAHCRYYHFELTTGSIRYRYPDTGYLMTFGEGDCSADFSMESAVVVDRQDERKTAYSGKLAGTRGAGDNVRLFDLQGRMMRVSGGGNVAVRRTGVYIVEESRAVSAVMIQAR